MTNKKEQTIQIHVKGNIYLSIYQSFTGRQETMPVVSKNGKTVMLGDQPVDINGAKDLMDHILLMWQGDYSIWSALSEEHDQYYEEEMQ